MTMLTRPLRRDCELRLFCLPYAGGSAQVFREWGRHVPADIEVVALELRGRGARFREQPDTRLASIVTEVSDTIAAVSDRPFALFGHSMGALAAYEVARVLEGHPHLRHLSVSACRPPQVPAGHPPLHELPDSDLLEHLRRLDATSAALQNAELMALMLPVIRADLMACERHQSMPGPVPLACSLTAVGGDADPLVPVAVLRDWGVHATGPFQVHTFPGGHFFFQTCLPRLIATLVSDLRETVR